MQVLGLAMRPYSLGHELWLIRQSNPFALFAESPSHLTVPAKFPEAVLICSQSFEEAGAMNSDWLIRLKLKLWNRRTAHMNLFTEADIFRKYQSEGALRFPCNPPKQSSDSAPSRYVGAPFLIRVHQFLVMNFRLTQNEAWDFPFGLAQMYHAAWLEQNNQSEIKNEQDIQVDAEREKWMKEHPESGVEIVKEETCPAS